MRRNNSGYRLQGCFCNVHKEHVTGRSHVIASKAPLRAPERCARINRVRTQAARGAITVLCKQHRQLKEEFRAVSFLFSFTQEENIDMDCGVLTSKSVLLIISLMFWAAAAGLAYVGSYVLNTYKTYDPFLQDQNVLLPAVIIICIATVMFVIGLIGCCATLRESRIGLGVFMFIILLIFIAEVAAFTIGFIYRSKVDSDFHKPLQDVFQKYNGKNQESHIIDYLQEELQCCGVSNYTDWIGSAWYNTTANNSIPESCCKQEFSKNCTGRLSEPQYLNTKGCEQKMVSAIQNLLSYVMVVLLGFATVKFFGMMSICVLTCRRDNGYDSLPSGIFA